MASMFTPLNLPSPGWPRSSTSGENWILSVVADSSYPTNLAPRVETAALPSESANSPMGVAQGIHPGRVVWVHNADATRWDGATGNWWDDQNTDPKAVDAMVSSALRGLTGQASDAQAWDALFRHFNKTRGAGEAGYRKIGRAHV